MRPRGFTFNALPVRMLAPGIHANTQRNDHLMMGTSRRDNATTRGGYPLPLEPAPQGNSRIEPWTLERGGDMHVPGFKTESKIKNAFLIFDFIFDSHQKLKNLIHIMFFGGN